MKSIGARRHPFLYTPVFGFPPVKNSLANDLRLCYNVSLASGGGYSYISGRQQWDTTEEYLSWT